jgi:hypothetical protein
VIDARWLNARLTLGMALVKHVLASPFRRRQGSRSWLATLRRESLAATPPGAWGLFAPSSRCIGCGLCDTVAAAGESPSTWILGEGRRPEDAPLALAHAARLRELAPAIDQVCPTRVDVRALAQLIEKNASMLSDREPG